MGSAFALLIFLVSSISAEAGTIATQVASSAPAINWGWSMGSTIQAAACSGGVMSGVTPDVQTACHMAVCSYGQTSQMGYATFHDSAATFTSGYTYSCTGHVTQGTVSYAYPTTNLTGAASCPATYVMNAVSNMCDAGTTTPKVCPPGYTMSGSTCTNACPDAGASDGNFGGSFLSSGGRPSSICAGGCGYAIGGNSYTYGPASARFTVTTGSYATGATCVGADTTAVAISLATPSPASCAANGQGYMTVNSITTCVSAGSAGASALTVTNNSVSTSTNTAGAVTTTTTTTANTFDNGVVTSATTGSTSTAGINSLGQPTTTNGSSTSATATATQSSFCAQNPTDKSCGTGSGTGSASGGSDCSSAPVCSGDPVGCATLAQIWHSRCDLETTSTIQALGANVLNGSDPLLAALPSAHNPTSVSIGSLNMTETFAANCPAPLNFTVYGKTYSFDQTPMCTLGGVIGYLNVLSSLFIAGMIIARGFA